MGTFISSRFIILENFYLKTSSFLKSESEFGYKLENKHGYKKLCEIPTCFRPQSKLVKVGQTKGLKIESFSFHR
jgi:hypothetical protein